MDLRCLRTLATTNGAMMFAALMLLSQDAFARPSEPVRVESGLVQGMLEDGLTIYRGIPFAAPPVGDLRWRAPLHIASGSTRAGPIVNEEGLKALDEYFAWRRSTVPVQGGAAHEIRARARRR
jgi:hypothetical protein